MHCRICPARGRRGWSGLFLAGLLGCLAGSGCSGLSRQGGARREGTRLIEEKDYDGAAAEFEKAVALAAEPEEKARALVELGQARLKAGHAAEALKDFYSARRTYHEGQVAGRTNAGIGEAYFELGDYALARRYLTKGLEDSRGDARERLLAKLVISSRGLDDVASATEYRGKLKQPLSDEVKAILGTEPKARPDRIPLALEGEEKERPPAVARPARPFTPPVETPAPGEPKSIRIYSRESWQARPPKPNIELMGRVDKITVHHTGGENVWGASASETAEEIRKIQRYHQNDQGWADIGYHFIIDRSGAIWQGRRLRYQGAHARGKANYGNVGIVVLGNYFHQGITAVQKHSLEVLIEKLCDVYGIPASSVYTHREILQGKTDCPGPALTRCVDSIREDLRHRLVAYRPGD